MSSPPRVQTAEGAKSQPRAVLAERLSALELAFNAIAEQRMAGVAVMHPRVHVQADPFVLLDAQMALGVLITPWFMNLLRLPLTRSDERRVGAQATHHIGAHVIEFTSAFEAAIGAFECCSVYSPLTQFEDHAAVHATAQALMRALLPAGADDVKPALGRRALLFGPRAAAVDPRKVR
jgi:[NiFe] hydrogenase assembly HybE family chaperone